VTDAAMADGKPVHLHGLVRGEYLNTPQLTLNLKAEQSIKALDTDDAHYDAIRMRYEEEKVARQQPTSIDKSSLPSPSYGLM